VVPTVALIFVFISSTCTLVWDSFIISLFIYGISSWENLKCTSENDWLFRIYKTTVFSRLLYKI